MTGTAPSTSSSAFAKYPSNTLPYVPIVTGSIYQNTINIGTSITGFRSRRDVSGINFSLYKGVLIIYVACPRISYTDTQTFTATETLYIMK